MKYLIGFILISLCATQVNAQRIIIHEDVREREEVSEYGPNRKHYIHTFVGWGFIAGNPAGPGSEIIAGRSNSFEAGARYKRKLTHNFSFGIEVSYARNSFHIKQSSEKTFPDRRLYNSQVLILSNLSSGIYKRINYGRRGNYIGKFTDIGINSNWVYRNRITSINYDKHVEIKETISGHDFINTSIYNAFIRVGFNNLVFKGSYRLNDIFESGSWYDELPKYYIGIELGIHPL